MLYECVYERVICACVYMYVRMYVCMHILFSFIYILYIFKIFQEYVFSLSTSKMYVSFV